MSDASTKTTGKSKSAWTGRKVHTDITLPSGMKVDITLPNLPALIKSGALPNELIEVATKAATNKDIPEDLFERLDEFNRFLVAKTVVKPAITEDEVDQLPSEDIEMLVEFATRQRDMDAIGHHYAGLETVDSFRQFRRLDASSPGLFGM